jgi:hypothetical protein
MAKSAWNILAESMAEAGDPNFVAKPGFHQVMTRTGGGAGIDTKMSPGEIQTVISLLRKAEKSPQQMGVHEMQVEMVRELADRLQKILGRRGAAAADAPNKGR